MLCECRHVRGLSLLKRWVINAYLDRISKRHNTSLVLYVYGLHQLVCAMYYINLPKFYRFVKYNTYNPLADGSGTLRVGVARMTHYRVCPCLHTWQNSLAFICKPSIRLEAQPLVVQQTCKRIWRWGVYTTQKYFKSYLPLLLWLCWYLRQLDNSYLLVQQLIVLQHFVGKINVFQFNFGLVQNAVQTMNPALHILWSSPCSKIACILRFILKAVIIFLVGHLFSKRWTHDSVHFGQPVLTFNASSRNCIPPSICITVLWKNGSIGVLNRRHMMAGLNNVTISMHCSFTVSHSWQSSQLAFI